MTSAHILYIPTIFLLGFLSGSLAGKGFNSSDNTANESGITGKVLLGSFVIFAIVFIGTHFFEIPRSSKAVTKALNGVEIFDKKPAYTSAQVYSRMELFPENGRLLYQQFTYTIDILFPITLFAFLFLLSRFVIKRITISRTLQIVLMAVPILWLSMDFIENAIIFNLLNDYPVKHYVLAGSLGYITITKFSLLLLSILGPTLLITLHNMRRRVSTNS
jgi:hypothetical protein